MAVSHMIYVKLAHVMLLVHRNTLILQNGVQSLCMTDGGRGGTHRRVTFCHIRPGLLSNWHKTLANSLLPPLLAYLWIWANTVQPPTKTTYVWKQTDTCCQVSGIHLKVHSLLFSVKTWQKSWRGLCCQIWLITNLQRLLILHSYDVRKWPRCAFC